MSDARDVIARALFEIKGLGARYNLTIEQADAIIAAFTAAGYEIVQRDAIKCPHCNDTGMIWSEGGHGPSACIDCWRLRDAPFPPLDDKEPQEHFNYYTAYVWDGEDYAMMASPTVVGKGNVVVYGRFKGQEVEPDPDHPFLHRVVKGEN